MNFNLGYGHDHVEIIRCKTGKENELEEIPEHKRYFIRCYPPPNKRIILRVEDIG